MIWRLGDGNSFLVCFRLRSMLQALVVEVAYPFLLTHLRSQVTEVRNDKKNKPGWMLQQTDAI